jgi:hypothetical protein
MVGLPVVVLVLVLVVVALSAGVTDIVLSESG